jgi:hypothetical protein
LQTETEPLPLGETLERRCGLLVGAYPKVAHSERVDQNLPFLRPGVPIDVSGELFRAQYAIGQVGKVPLVSEPGVLPQGLDGVPRDAPAVMPDVLDRP